MLVAKPYVFFHFSLNFQPFKLKPELSLSLRVRVRLYIHREFFPPINVIFEISGLIRPLNFFFFFCSNKCVEKLRTIKNITNDSNFANNNTYKYLSIYHDKHKFFTQPIYQSIHHALNFYFLMTMIVIDIYGMYISLSTLTRCC